ncbi:hypothetical protein [Egicoccus sp. AB-alg6-2]|uniref:hypothetical protein n=1 Tax=Egicoccus sp. AB-alg6-2 TaxID=3242692 RepID=UPI00359DDD10
MSTPSRAAAASSPTALHITITTPSGRARRRNKQTASNATKDTLAGPQATPSRTATSITDETSSPATSAQSRHRGTGG